MLESTQKVTLTPRTLDSLRPAKTGKRYEIRDTVVPGLRIRVTDAVDTKGKASRRTFVLLARYPVDGKLATYPSRRSLGEYRARGKAGESELAAARKKALAWLDLIARGIDPAAEEERVRKEAEEVVAAKERANAERGTLTFGAAIEDYITNHVRKTRKAADVEREIRKELIPRWRDKLVAEIGEDDVIAVVREIANRGALYQAHNIFGHVRTFYSWLVGTGGRKKYGFQIAPTYGLKPSKLIGPKLPRQRTLARRDDSDELLAYWRAAKRIGYPVGPFLQLLLLTGCRKSEVSGARWREFHPELVRVLRDHAANGKPIDWRAVPIEWRTWTVPASRFKSAVEHLVPLTDEALAILATLPWFSSGDCLFTTTFGKTPINGFSKAKVRLDAHMLRTLQAVTRRRGADPKAVKLQAFKLHDIRRTVRTKLSALKVAPHVAEMVIGHGKKGLARTYDQHEYLPEMRKASDEWTAHLRDIVTPPRGNVVPMRRGGAA